jgi:hypothetical protein
MYCTTYIHIVYVRDRVVIYRLPTIIGHRYDSNHELEFLVSWLGFDSSHDSFEPFSGVHELEALDIYATANPTLRIPTTTRRRRLN